MNPLIAIAPLYLQSLVFLYIIHTHRPLPLISTMNVLISYYHVSVEGSSCPAAPLLTPLSQINNAAIQCTARLPLSITSSQPAQSPHNQRQQSNHRLPAERQYKYTAMTEVRIMGVFPPIYTLNIPNIALGRCLLCIPSLANIWEQWPLNKDCL